ncbi:MAG TPA: NAD-dependent succinate-semialdehyde dehydrogenase [Alphaproteobacteria bacterium]
MSDTFFFPSKMLIHGEWVDALNGVKQDVFSPGDQSLVGAIAYGGEEETERAIQSASQAFTTWKKVLPAERARLLRKFYELMIARKDELAKIMTAESGKPMAESRAEIDYAASFLELYAEEIRRIYGETIPTINHDRRFIVMRQPIGVCAAITPWNFPSSMVTRKVGAALAAGCTIVLKPDHRTPFSALALGALALEAGIPAGVFNIVLGPAPEIGQYMCAHHTVRKVTFTGSTEVGRVLMAQCAPTIKRLSLELGGNAPFIICEDANPHDAAQQLVTGKMRNAGQSCVSPNRVMIHKKHYEWILTEITSLMQKLQVGPGTDEKNNVGPLIDRKGVEKVDALVQDALKKGARCLLGGKPHAAGQNFYSPTVIADISPEMEIAHKEIFGPVIAASIFESDDEIIARANNSEYGLASYVFTNDYKRLFRYAEELEYGMVGFNAGVTSTSVTPFGGIKQSGLGREGSHFGLEEYLNVKSVCVAGLA